MEGRKYHRVLEAIAQEPWAITPEMLATICEIARFRADGGLFGKEEIQERVGARASRRDPYTTASSGGGAIAVIPLYGVIAPKVNLMTEYSGGTALSEFRASFQQALADPGVGSILIDVDSPGGSVSQVAETATEIRAARGTKPITAIANTLCASAAYWLACQADELVSTITGLIGSIGVFTVHDNLEGALTMAGVERTLISAGQFKTDGNPWQPLSETAKAAAQAMVDDTYDLFVADVAAGRGVSVDAVRNGFGQGRVVTPTAALAEGMIDRVASFDETVAGLMQPTRAAGRKAELAATKELPAAAVAAEPRDFGDMTASLRQTHQAMTQETQTNE